MRILPLILLTAALAATPARAASFLDKLFGGKKSDSGGAPALSLDALTQDQMVAGLKEALAKGVQNAVTNLARADGYLTNLHVRIPMPENLQRVEKTLRKLKQDAIADEFITTMNRAAEAAVPEAAAIFADAIRQMTLDDARALLRGQEDAATQFFKRTGETRLQEKMSPIVKAATAKAGVTSAYKQLTDKAGVAAAFVRLPTASDLDQYVTQKASDGLFKMIAEEEKRIRQNPAARTTDLLKQVFGAVKK